MWSFLLPALLAVAEARSTGITGVSVGGCSCHAAAADATTTVAFVGLPTSVNVGTAVPVTVTVSTSNGARTRAGLNVSATGGTFTATAGTQVLNGELTHTTPKLMVGGTATFTFTWTAPAVAGSYSLRVAGNAVNFNGLNTGDGWNRATNATIQVTNCQNVDGDGFTTCTGDCDDARADVFPGATERCNTRDDDCDGQIDESAVDAPTWYPDPDLDTWGVNAGSVAACVAPPNTANRAGDCNNNNPNIRPGAPDPWYDGVDSNCLGDDDYDQDLDGHRAPSIGGDDCDDTDAAIHPGAMDAWYDGVDSDCLGDNDFDADADGATAVAWGGTDCNDTNRSIRPSAAEIWYDGVDQNCDGNDDDQDEDGTSLSVDCDDLDPEAYPGANEIVDDGVDQDCLDGDACWIDLDGDGFTPDHAAYIASADLDCADPGEADVSAPLGDCDDADPDIAPGAFDQPGDGVDADCDGQDACTDADNDAVCDTADFFLEVTPTRAGQPLTVRALRAPPGARVFFLASRVGPGAGPCTTSANGTPLCAGVRQPVMLPSAVANAAGTATINLTLPRLPAGSSLWFQAAEAVGSGDVTQVEQRTVAP